MNACEANQGVVTLEELEHLVRRTAEAAAEATVARLGVTAPDGDSGAEVRTLVALSDRVEDALHALYCRIGQSKRQRKRRAPDIRALAVVHRSILQRLNVLGVTPMPSAKRADFALHEPIELVPTQDRAQEGVVVDIVRRGFLRGNRVLRLQQVSVLTFVPPRQHGNAGANQQ